MLYISISDSYIEVFQTAKSFFGGEKIKSSFRKEIESNIVVNGLIKNPQALAGELLAAFSKAYPKEIHEKNVNLLVPDLQSINFRFELPVTDKNEDLSVKIIDEAKKILPDNPNNYEHFYKEINTSSQVKEILYASMLKKTILEYANFFRSLGMELNFITNQSYAIYELLKPLAHTKELILYCEVTKETFKYFVFDKFCTVLNHESKTGNKIFEHDLKTFLKNLKEKNIEIFKIVIGGSESIELRVKELEDDTGIKVYKIGEIMDDLLNVHKISFDSGGVAKMMYVNSLGFFILKKHDLAPNFCLDLNLLLKNNNIQIESITETNVSIIKEEIAEKEVVSNNAPNIENLIASEMKIDNKDNKGTFSRIFSNKIFIIVLSTLFVFVVMIGVFSLFKDNSAVKLPFFTAPSPTPTITPLPTMTPTPTIDTTLKRSDLKISVQNGTDKAGYAKEFAAFLEKAEYKNIAKSNADKDTYKESVIKIKDSKKKYLPLFTADIKEKIKSPTVEVLPEEEKTDIILILGQN